MHIGKEFLAESVDKTNTGADFMQMCLDVNYSPQLVKHIFIEIRMLSIED